MIMSTKERKIMMESKSDRPKMTAGFSVPDGYFDSFSERLARRMEMEQPVHKKSGLMLYLRPALGVAASLAILLSIYLRFPSRVTTEEISLANTTVDSLRLADQTEQLSSNFVALLSEKQLISAFSEMDEFDASKMPKDALAEYLANDCSDLEILNASK